MISEWSYTVFFEDAVKASRDVRFDAGLINKVLTDLAKEAVAQTAHLIIENQKDLTKMDKANPNYDRLKLTAARIEGIANDILNVAGLDNPLGLVLSETVMPNGLNISKVSVPLGVIGVIYEARPNVTFDVFALCFKTGNICVLKGGSDAAHSNHAIIQIIHKVLLMNGVNPNAAILMPPERAATEAMFNAVGYINVLIPRGSQGLINQARQNSKVPVIETGAGIVHTYFDEWGDLEKGCAISFNAKTRRVSVCNALDCFIIHNARLSDLARIIMPLFEAGVEIYADERAYNAVIPEVHLVEHQQYIHLLHRAKPEHFGTEFLSMRMAVKTVDSLEGAMEHIAKHGSKHSEAIITEDAAHAGEFLNRVDAAAVYVNASTAFTDGAQFGLGAEIGISTQKLHARGPMGLKELTSYKWIVKGKGQIRS